MRRRIRAFPVSGVRLLGLALALLIGARPAYGYIDPLSGSIILQVVAASVLAVTFTVRSFWARTLGAVRRLWSRLRGV